jgi:hypothetical protein
MVRVGIVLFLHKQMHRSLSLSLSLPLPLPLPHLPPCSFSENSFSEAAFVVILLFWLSFVWLILLSLVVPFVLSTVRTVQQEGEKGRAGLVRVRVRVRIARVGVAVFLHKQKHRALSLSLSLLFLSPLFQRITLASDHFPQNNCALSPLLCPGGYCPAGSSAVTSCPAGVIEWLLYLHPLAFHIPLSLKSCLVPLP